MSAERTDKNKLEINKIYIHQRPWAVFIFKPLKMVKRSIKPGYYPGDPMEIEEDYRVEVLLHFLNEKYNRVKGQTPKDNGKTIVLRNEDTIHDSEKLDDLLNDRFAKFGVFEDLFKAGKNIKI